MKEKIRNITDLGKYVVFSITVVLIYTVSEFVVSTFTGVSHDILTGCVYGFFAGEIVTCGLIKMLKIRENGKGEGGESYG